MGLDDKKNNNFRKYSLIFGCILISGIVAKIIYVLFGLGLSVLIPGGSDVKGLMFIFALVLTIFTWVTCFKWLYTYLKKDFFNTEIPHNQADEPDVKS